MPGIFSGTVTSISLSEMVNPKEDVLDFSKTEITLMVLGSLYSVLCMVILFMVARNEDIIAVSHRFRYAFFMVATVFARALCCFIGVGEAQYARGGESLLPFLIFEIPNLMTLVGALSLAGAQIRNVLACSHLRNDGIITNQGYSNRQEGEEPAVQAINVDDWSSRTSSRQPLLSKAVKGVTDFCIPSVTCCKRRPSVAQLIYVLSFLLCVGYFVLTVVLYTRVPDGKKRNSAEQLFFAAFNAVTLAVLTTTMVLEYLSGCLTLIPRKGRPNLYSATRTEYAQRQHEISLVIILLLGYHVGWALGLFARGTENEFANPYYFLIIEYGVEFVLITWFFAKLNKVIHGPFNMKDPIYLEKLFNNFQPGDGTALPHSEAKRGIRLTIKLKRRDAEQSQSYQVEVVDLLELQQLLHQTTAMHLDRETTFAADASGTVLSVDQLVPTTDS
eukprot:gb/GECG01008125.1/.p1 GENE.gb/GECG01008125.1/~~gb/GECG01008125.1/.p1  ORF type:complete len:445 (+),score=27.32 gb/GECG01008125.1/:1-1335(+)